MYFDFSTKFDLLFKSHIFFTVGDDIKRCDSCIKNARIKCVHSFTQKAHEHVAVNYCFVIVNREGEVIHESVYTGEDAASHFLRNLSELQPDLENYIESCIEMDITQEEQVMPD